MQDARMQDCKVSGLQPTVFIRFRYPPLCLPPTEDRVESAVGTFAAFQTTQVIDSERRRQLLEDVLVDGSCGHAVSHFVVLQLQEWTEPLAKIQKNPDTQKNIGEIFCFNVYVQFFLSQPIGISVFRVQQ